MGGTSNSKTCQCVSVSVIKAIKELVNSGRIPRCKCKF